MDDRPMRGSREEHAWMWKELKTVEPRAGSTPGLNETEEEGSWAVGLGLCQKSSGEPLKCLPQEGEMVSFMLCKDLPGSHVYIFHRLKPATVRLHHCDA